MHTLREWLTKSLATNYSQRLSCLTHIKWIKVVQTICYASINKICKAINHGIQKKTQSLGWGMWRDNTIALVKVNDYRSFTEISDWRAIESTHSFCCRVFRFILLIWPHWVWSTLENGTIMIINVFFPVPNKLQHEFSIRSPSCTLPHSLSLYICLSH